MAKLDIDVAEVKKLIELVQRHDLEELTVEEADLSITIKGQAVAAAVVVEAAPRATAAGATPAQAAAPVTQEAPSASEQEAERNVVDIVAPLVGVFYRSPAPDAPSFVEVGDQIEVGTEIGLIEAMKVFSPIPSEVAGEVVAIPGESGKLVQQGDILVRVRVAE